jgi:hypothetical protein
MRIKDKVYSYYWLICRIQYSFCMKEKPEQNPTETRESSVTSW